MRSDSLCGAGALPLLTQLKNVLRETGIIAGIGGVGSWVPDDMPDSIIADWEWCCIGCL